MHSNAIIKLFAALVAASAPVLAEVGITSPTATTTCTGGSQCTVTWKESGTGPSLAQQGNCTFALYIGNSQQQTFLQPIAYPDAVNVATTQSIIFTVDPTVGANDNHYFIRVSSTTLTQNTTTGAATTLPYLSFSAMFTLNGMTGTFNQTVQNQIAGISSSAGASSTATSHTTAASSSRSSTTSSHTTSTSHGAGFKDGVSGALVAGAAFFAGAVALF